MGAGVRVGKVGKDRGVLICTRLDCETAAEIIRNTPDRSELAAIFHRSRARMRGVIWELRELGYDCGEWGAPGRPPVKDK